MGTQTDLDDSERIPTLGDLSVARLRLLANDVATTQVPVRAPRASPTGLPVYLKSTESGLWFPATLEALEIIHYPDWLLTARGSSAAIYYSAPVGTTGATRGDTPVYMTAMADSSWGLGPEPGPTSEPVYTFLVEPGAPAEPEWPAGTSGPHGYIEWVVLTRVRLIDFPAIACSAALKSLALQAEAARLQTRAHASASYDEMVAAHEQGIWIP